MSSTSSRLHSFPTQLEVADYARAQDEFLDRALGCKAVTSVLRFGSVTHPGLSDLDFILVIDDDAVGVPSTVNHITGLSKITQYVLYHPQFVLPRSLVEELRWLVPVFELEVLYGSPAQVLDISADSVRHLTIAYILQATITDLSWVFQGMHAKRSFDVRMTQAKLNLLAKNLQLASQVDSSFQPGPFPHGVASLRREWFNVSIAELSHQLHCLIQMASEELMRLRSWLSTQVTSEPHDNTHPLYVHRFEGVSTRFSSSHGDLDSRLLAYIQPFSTVSGRIGAWVQNTMVPNALPRLAEVAQVVGRRASLAEAHVRWIEMSGLTSGVFNYLGYPVGYRPGPRSRLRRLLWNISLKLEHR